VICRTAVAHPTVPEGFQPWRGGKISNSKKIARRSEDLASWLLLEPSGVNARSKTGIEKVYTLKRRNRSDRETPTGEFAENIINWGFRR